MNKVLLSKTISFKEAVSEFDMNFDEAVNNCLTHAGEDGLKIYFHAEVNAYESDFPCRDVFDWTPDGSMVIPDISDGKNKGGLMAVLGEVMIICARPAKADETDETDEVQDAQNQIAVSEFKYEGKNYRPVAVERESFKVTYVPLDNLYLINNEYKKFLKTPDHFDKTSPVGKPTPNDMPGYLDPEHKNYSIELHAAIQAWHHANNSTNQHKTFKQAIKKYLSSNKEFNISPTAKDRVSSVANSNINKRNK